MAAVGDIGRSSSPQKLVSYFGLTPNVRQWGSVLPITGGLARVGRSHARAMLVEAAWAAGWQAKEERKPI
ncbi:transposase [Mesorhizobium australicum]